jgi:uncharacterized protein YqeY
MLEQLEKDIKTALLAGDKTKTETLKVLKSALQYEAVAKKLKPEDLTDEQIQAVLAREAKKRTEAADLYEKAGEAERAAKEKAEKDLIAAYLPAQMDTAKTKSPTPAARPCRTWAGLSAPSAHGPVPAQTARPSPN